MVQKSSTQIHQLMPIGLSTVSNSARNLLEIIARLAENMFPSKLRYFLPIFFGGLRGRLYRENSLTYYFIHQTVHTT